jgi:hypothetical protein
MLQIPQWAKSIVGNVILICGENDTYHYEKLPESLIIPLMIEQGYWRIEYAEEGRNKTCQTSYQERTDWQA